MPVTIISTPGATNANSLLDLTRADELALEHPHAGAWTAETDTDKKSAALIMFSRIVSATCFKGKRTFTGQSMAFPRTGLKYDSDTAVDSTTIPVEAEIATFVGALGLLQRDTTLPSSQLTEGLTKLKADVVELGFRSDLRYKALPDHVRSLIPEGWFCVDSDLTGKTAVLKVFG